MTRSFHSFFILLVLFTSAGTSAAQVQTGTPPFGSLGGGPDVINLANLNSHITIPVRHKAGRGINFDYDLKNDSSVWYPLNSGGSTSWQPAFAQWGWNGLIPAGQSTIFYSMTYTSSRCGDGGSQTYAEWMFGNFVYVDIFGTQHSFNYNPVYFSSPGGSGCPPNGPQPPTVQPTPTYDGSGYTLYATPGPGSASAYLVDRSGSTIYPSNSPSPQGSTSMTDRNGNQITSSNGSYTDTLGTVVLSVVGTAPSNTNISYTAPSGATATYTVKYSAYTVRTNFLCSGITEFNASGTAQYSLVSEIDLPDVAVNPNNKYTFTYETTPGDTHSPHHVTGRLASVTLPTGGTISYAYSGGGTGVNGITCADGSAATLTRITSDGTWTYTRAPGTGAASTTTITDPQNNQTVIRFQGIYETQRQVYKDSSTTGTLLQTTNTCYNGSASPCTGTAITLPITRRSQFIQLPDASGKQCEHDFFYNTYGLLTELDDYDYGPSGGGVGSLIRKTLKTYATLGNGIVDMPASITVQDGGSITKAQTTFTYDEGTVTATSGTPQQVSVTGSRGNLTTVKSYKDGTNFLTTTATYFDTGNVNTATDVNNAQTTFTYGACGNSFPTSVSEPLTLSRSMTWNCTGGVQTSVTDENGQPTSTAYTDVYFWRPASTTDPAGAVTTFSYPSPSAAESTLSFNSSNSVVDIRTNLDGLGRPQVRQVKQGPSSANYDSVETDYDSLGRPKRVTMPYSGTVGQTNSNAPAITKTYDALSRVLALTDAGNGSTSYTYTQNDALMTIGPAPTGENTKRRQYEYDALGRLTSVCELTGATGSGTCAQNPPSPIGYWTKYTYDVLGNLTGVTQNAQASSAYQQTRTYSYDALSRMTAETNPESGMTTYVYDTDATVVSRILLKS